MSGDRGTMPSPVNTCRDCGRDVIASDLGIAEHRAYHLAWHATYGPNPRPSTVAQLSGWSSYALALERDSAARVAAAGALWDDERDRLLEDIADRDQIIEDLRADLAKEPAP